MLGSTSKSFIKGVLVESAERDASRWPLDAGIHKNCGNQSHGVINYTVYITVEAVSGGDAAS